MHSPSPGNRSRGNVMSNKVLSGDAGPCFLPDRQKEIFYYLPNAENVRVSQATRINLQQG